jgi:hypothetical protein
VVADQPGIISMEKYLDIEEQPWHTE